MGLKPLLAVVGMANTMPRLWQKSKDFLLNYLVEEKYQEKRNFTKRIRKDFFIFRNWKESEVQDGWKEMTAASIEFGELCLIGEILSFSGRQASENTDRVIKNGE